MLHSSAMGTKSCVDMEVLCFSGNIISQRNGLLGPARHSTVLRTGTDSYFKGRVQSQRATGLEGDKRQLPVEGIHNSMTEDSSFPWSTNRAMVWLMELLVIRAESFPGSKQKIWNVNSVVPQGQHSFILNLETLFTSGQTSTSKKCAWAWTDSTDRVSTSV